MNDIDTKNTNVRNNKGFTLIELIVVMAIIGILVLLAAPKFLGYTKDANATAMRQDAKVVSDAVVRYNIDNEKWPVANTDDVTDAVGSEQIIEDLDQYVSGLSGGRKTTDFAILNTDGDVEYRKWSKEDILDGKFNHTEDKDGHYIKSNHDKFNTPNPNLEGVTKGDTLEDYLNK